MNFMAERIAIGDKVHVRFWPMYDDILGEVKYMPQAQGESWIIVSEQGDVYYIQTFASITRKADVPEVEDLPF
jgi:hypothetical protein